MSCYDCKIDDTKCPVCGKANNCLASKYCWCFEKKGKLDKYLLPISLENLPKSCLCQACWEKYQSVEPK